MFAIAGSSMDPGAIGRYDDLNGVSANLRDENPESPVMTACTSVRAGNGSITARLEPLLSEITVNSICCDFHKKPYAGQKLEDGTLENNGRAKQIPLLLMHGEKDRICDVAGSRTIADRMKADGENVEYIEWGGLYHEIHNGGSESKGDEVIAKTVEWAKKI